MKRPPCLLVLAGAAIASSISSAVSSHTAPAGSGPPRATVVTFAGTWIGHSRSLNITRRGRARESIYSGCCDPVLNLTFRLSRPRGTPLIASATATVTAVWVRDRSAFTKAQPAPHVGETRTLRLRNGVITESLTGTNYCDNKAENDGKCGA